MGSYKSPFKKDHLASLYVHIVFHGVLSFWIIYSLDIPIHKVDRKPGFRRLTRGRLYVELLR